MTLYFAYGSNMWDDQMARRCPGSRKIGRGTLAEYRWIITTRGYASVVPSPGDVVEGVLFELTPENEAALDGFEGVARGDYFKINLPVMHQGKGSHVEALVYIDPITAEGPPKDEYIQRINNGIADADLPPEYVRRYLRRFVPAPQPR